jgi:hypothetical protein
MPSSFLGVLGASSSPTVRGGGRVRSACPFTKNCHKGPEIKSHSFFRQAEERAHEAPPWAHRKGRVRAKQAPDNIATSSADVAPTQRTKGPVHVDQKIVNEVLSAATCDITKNLSQIMLNWCKFIVQSPHHKGGYAITPKAPQGAAWVFARSRRRHPYPSCSRRRHQVPQATTSFLVPSLISWKQPGPTGKMLEMLRKDVACGCKGESQGQSCVHGPSQRRACERRTACSWQSQRHSTHVRGPNG